MRRIVWMSSAAALLAGCGSSGPTEPSNVELEFFTKVVFGLATQVTKATAGAAEIEIEGIIVAPHTGYSVQGQLVPVSGRLDVVVTARKERQGLDYATQNYYAATLLRLRPGDYPVRVLHVVERDRVDTTVVLNRTVTVR